MRTRIIRLDADQAGPSELQDIVRTLTKERLAVFPTDTFYGMGGNGVSRRVIRSIFKIKRRDPAKPLLVLVSGLEMVRELAVDIPDVFWGAADEFWPGRLTIVLKAAPAVPLELGGGSGTIAMRLPDVRWLREVVRSAGVPLIATSANLSGRGEIREAGDAVRTFRGKVDLIIDGGQAPGGAPSTVLDLASVPPRIVRPGAVSAVRLQKYLERPLT